MSLCLVQFILATLQPLFFLSSVTTCPYAFRGLPPGCGRSVTDFCGWDVHEARLRCPDEVGGDI
jgi:hypothetical protein